MNATSNNRLSDIEHELKALRAELAEIRKQRTARHSWRFRTGFLGVPLIMIVSWVWSAQASNPIPPDIEKRLSALESLVRKGPGNTVQVTAPFDVVGPDGKAILRVGSGAQTAGAVAIWSLPDKPGRVAIRSDKGTVLAELGVMKEGYGSVTVADEEGVTRAQLYGAGKVEVLNEEKKIIAGMGAIKIVGMEAVNYLGEVAVTGRVAVLDDNGAIRAALNNAGQVIVADENQKIVARMEATDKGSGRVMTVGEIIAVDERENKVAGLDVTSEGGGRVAVWSKGHAVARMEVNDKTGSAGAVTVMNAESKVVAKMGADQDNRAAGVVFAADAEGTVRTQLKGSGEAVVFDADKNPVARMVAADKNRGRVLAFGEVLTVDKKGDKVAGIEVTSEGSGEVAVWNKQGKKVAQMSTGGRDGLGSVYLSDSKGERPQTIIAAGAVAVFDKEGHQVAGIEAESDGRGEVSVWNKDKKVAEIGSVGKEGDGSLVLSNSKGTIRNIIAGGVVAVFNKKGEQMAGMEVEEENGNTGTVTIMNSMGKVATKMSADKANAGKLSVMNAEGKPVVGLTGGNRGGIVAVANSTSVPLAEMSVSDDGRRGIFQVNQNQKPMAVLTEAIESPGGLLQLFNNSQPVVSVTVSRKGAGYWQLTNAAGLPTVEAGTNPEGEGVVRAGPFYGCIPINASLPSPLITPGFGFPDCIKGNAKAGAAGKYLKK